MDPGLHCPRCLLLRRVCLCADIPQVDNRTKVLIVRHHREINRSSNTGRLAHFALRNSEIIDYGTHGGPVTLPSLDGAYVVFPAGPPMNVAPSPPPKQLVILDATWSQARKMYQKIHQLRGVPTLSLPIAPMPAARLRNSPAEGAVSTIEAIARALRLVEDDSVARTLENVFQLAVERAAMTGRTLVS